MTINPLRFRRRCLLAAALTTALAACAPAEPTPPPSEAAPAPSESLGDSAQPLLTWSLGARYNAAQDTITFNVYSSRATRIEVWLYKNPLGYAEKTKYVMTKNTTTNVWTKDVSVATLANSYDITGTVYYGYRAWGPNWTYSASWTKGSSLGFVSDVDSQGNRFNPNKLLVDPYALELSHDAVNPTYPTSGAVFASGATNRNTDSGIYAPKGIVLLPDTTSTGTKPTRAFKDDIVYEVHVRGLTMSDTSIAAAYRGTYKGAGLKAAALASLGVTAVEFLPLHETDNDANDVNPTTTAGDNYWGYMNLNYFAPDRRYSSDKTPGGPTKEFKAMVKAFHDAGIKVLVDVVYNHTGEGGAWVSGDSSTFNVLSYRGLDNPTYYSLTSDRQHSWDNTGVGGNFNTFNTTAQNVILHSLSYWKDTLGVDGFRFDLASVLGNTCEHGCFNYDRTNSATALNRIMSNLDPRPAAGGAGTDFIAEPWAIGGNSYQVGNFPAQWSEWNGKFRDAFRKDQNQLGVEVVTVDELSKRFTGSSDLYGDSGDGRKPFNSVNFMVAHDGFTLKDLYSCNSKNNSQAWPYGPSDGGEDSNHSWDQGTGTGQDARQRQAARTGIAFLMLSAGVPMITGGDEFLRSQACNNNVYNLDSSANWLNYSWDTNQTKFRDFTSGMIAFRKAHPSLRPSDFYSTVNNNGSTNVMEQHRWFTPAGTVPDAGYFSSTSNHAIAFRVDTTEFTGEPAAINAIYVAYNGWSDAVTFTLPWPGTGKAWYRVTDTCPWIETRTPGQVVIDGGTDVVGYENSTYGVCGRGLLVLVAKNQP